MNPALDRPPPPVGPLRRLGKFALFAGRGLSPATAWWLACHDATKTNNYRGVARPALQAGWNAAGRWNDLVAANGHLASRELGVTFAGDDLFARGYEVLLALRRRGFAVRRDGAALEVTHARWTLQVATDEEISILREIFVEYCYEFHLPGRWNVLDVGANVGMASLYFAAQPWTAHVFAFEPFGPTADACAANLDRNHGLRDRITLQRVGLGEADATVEVDYHPELRGSMSVAGLGDWRGSAGGGRKISITVRRASAALAELEPKLAGKPLLVKLDCEGSEYGILRDLEATGWLERIDAIVMEWHQREPGELLTRLEQAGFMQHVRPLVEDRTLGLIIAVRRPKDPTIHG